MSEVKPEKIRSKRQINFNYSTHVFGIRKEDL